MPMSMWVLAVASTVMVAVMLLLCWIIYASRDSETKAASSVAIMALFLATLVCVVSLYQRAVEIEKSQIRRT